MADYDKVGLFTVRDGRMLLCRKKYMTALLILPGGCREAGETSLECLRRELAEELGEVDVEGLQYAGTYSDRAAGAEDKIVEIELYSGRLMGEPEARAEIKELVWFGPDDDEALLSPSLRNRIVPDLRARGLF